MKLFSETAKLDSKNSDGENKEINAYDQKVPAKEVEKFEEKMVEKIYAKAEEFGISKEELNNLNNNLDSLITELKENIKLDKERKVIKFEENLKEEINKKALESGKTEEEIANDETIKKLERKLQVEKEVIEHAKNDICHKAAFYNSDDLEKDIKEKAEEFGMSEENLMDVIEIIRESAFEKNIKENSKELKISKDVFYEFAEFNLNELKTDLNDEKNSDSELFKKSFQRGEFEFWKEDLYRGLNDIQRDEKTKDLKEKKLSKFEKFMESIKKHKKIISLGELALYISSSYGSAVLKDLAGSDVEIKIGDQKTSFKDLVDNPELLKVIKSGHTNLPFEIFSENEDQRFKEKFESFDIEFSLKVIEKEIENGNKEKYVYFDTLKHLHVSDKTVDEKEMFDNLEKNLNEIGISLNSQDGGCLIDNLASNMAKVVSIISKDLGLREREVEDYLETFVIAETSKFSVVEITELNDMKIKENIRDSKTILELEQKKIEIYDEIFNFYSGTHKEKQQKAIEEWENWGKENGYESYEDIERALEQERFDYENSVENKFEEIKAKEEEQVAEFKNMEEFEEIVLEKLKEAGYSIDELKEIAEDDPFEIYTIIAKIIGENTEYDWALYSKHILNIISKGKIVNNEDISRNASELPYKAMKDGKVVCDGKAFTFMAVKNVLEKNGVPDLDKTAVLDTHVETWHGKYGHVCNVLYFIDEKSNNLVIVPFDITFLEDEDLSKIPEKINVTNKSYSYNVKEKVNEAHQNALEKIKKYSLFTFQEKLKEVLTQYDPKLHKKEQEIKIDKEASELIAKRKEESSRKDKKNAVNSLP